MGSQQLAGITLASVRDKGFELREIKSMGRFGRLMRVGNETTNDIDHEVGHTAMPSMFDLRDVLELINNCFQDAAFSEQELVSQ